MVQASNSAYEAGRIVPLRQSRNEWLADHGVAVLFLEPALLSVRVLAGRIVVSGAAGER